MVLNFFVARTLSDTLQGHDAITTSWRFTNDGKQTTKPQRCRRKRDVHLCDGSARPLAPPSC